MSTWDEVYTRVKQIFPDAKSRCTGHFRIDEEPVNFETLMRLSNALGTMKFTVKGWSDYIAWSEYTAQNDMGIEIYVDSDDCNVKPTN